RDFAALILRRMFPGTAAAALIERSLIDVDPDVRKQAAVSLAHVADPAVAGPAVRALGSTRPLLRLHGAEALGWMGHAEAVPPLVEALLSSGAAPEAIAAAPRAFAFFGTQTAYVQDFDAEVATGSSIADPVISVLASGAVLDVRVVSASAGGWRRFDTAAMASLRRLTGENAGKRKRDWRTWWKDSDANPANAARVESQ
ncbi:MAG: HEAT repeat domain-containing protein, partial [Planctomycetota bacterium]